MLRRDTPVAAFVVMSLVIIAAILFSALGLVDHVSESAGRRAALRSDTQLLADQLAASLSLPVWNFDYPQIDKIVQSAISDKETYAVSVQIRTLADPSGSTYTGLIRDARWQPIPAPAVIPAGDSIVAERPVIANGDPVGTLKLYVTPRYMEEALWQQLRNRILMVVLFGAVLIAALYLLLYRTILRPLRLIERYAMEVSSGGDAPRPRSRSRFRGELERLGNSIEKMVELLAGRYAARLEAERLLEIQLRYDRLVATISAQLVAATPANVDGILTGSLAQIAVILDADRIVLGQTDESTGEMVARAHFRRFDPPFPDRLVISQRYPAVWRELLTGTVSNIADTASLQDPFTTDRTHFLEVGIKSQATVPVMIDGHLRFILAVATTSKKMIWSADLIARIKVIADVVATTALRCRAEEIVRSSEHQFRTFIEEAPVPIILVPAPDGAPIYFNPAFTRIFGYSREDLQHPEDWWNLLYPDANYRQARYDSWLQAVSRIRKLGEFQDTSEAEMRTKSGDTRFIQTRITIVEGYRMSFLNDLTDRRQAETALRLTQYAVDHNPVMIFRIDLDGRFVYANDAACTRFGYTPAEIMNLHIWDVAQTVSPEQWPARSSGIRQQGDANLESVYKTKSGEHFPVEVRLLYVQFSGTQHFFAFAHDITDRKAAQAAEHAYTLRIQTLATELTRSEERQRRELAAVLHDEVGQNLFAATTQLLAARNRANAGGGAGGGNGTSAEIDGALVLLDQVSRDTRLLTFELCPPVLYQMGLAPALQRLVELFAKRYNVECLLTGSGNGPADLNLRGLAYQAVRELLSNASRHAKARKIIVHLEETADTMLVTVTDDGVGFDPSTLTRGSGGFGLFQLKERIELLGGSLKISSAPSAGTKAAFSLPLAGGEAAQARRTIAKLAE